MIGLINLDHLLITIPPGATAQARKFYTDVLALKEIPGNHPRGAIWFEIGGMQLHIREEAEHQPHSDRHPAFTVKNLLESKKFLEQQKVEISYSSVIEGRDRCFFRDPFGNRFELIEYKNTDNSN